MTAPDCVLTGMDWYEFQSNKDRFAASVRGEPREQAEPRVKPSDPHASHMASTIAFHAGDNPTPLVSFSPKPASIC